MRVSKYYPFKARRRCAWSATCHGTWHLTCLVHFTVSHFARKAYAENINVNIIGKLHRFSVCAKRNILRPTQGQFKLLACNRTLRTHWLEWIFADVNEQWRKYEHYLWKFGDQSWVISSENIMIWFRHTPNQIELMFVVGELSLLIVCSKHIFICWLAY